jgi:hypothetical protein
MSETPSPGLFDDSKRPPLRYRRFGGGYRREDVDLLLAEFRLTLRSLELEVGHLRARARDLEERHEARGRVEALVAEGVAEAERRLDAARVRVDELNAARDRLVDELRQLVARVGAAIDGSAASGTEQGTGPGTASLRPLENGFPGTDLSGLRERDSTRVELDAGPFGDSVSVAGFERELAGLEDVEDVRVRHVNGDRATIELTVAAGTPLLAQMRERLHYDVEVRDDSPDRLVIDVGAAT